MARKLTVAAIAVALHTAANLAHGVPHAEIPVALLAWQQVFVYVVVLLVPLVAVGLLWRGRPETGGGRTGTGDRLTEIGAVLLAASMAASLAFGLYFHFGVPNPDNVEAVPAGPWRGHFQTTAVLVAVVDALGFVVGVWLVSNGVVSSVVPDRDAS